MNGENKTKKRFWAAASGVAIAVLAAFSYLIFFQTAGTGEPERFVVPLKSEKSAPALLQSAGFIKNTFGFGLASLLRGAGSVGAGGYKISKSWSAWQIAGVLAKEPYMKWVTIPEGWRKEQIAESLTQTLDWPEAEKNNWATTYTAAEANYIEGTYFPDTYLIPVDEPPQDVAKRMRARFEEKFAPYAKEAAAQNMKWTTLLKLASIIQREAAGKGDMPLISGILWNRLLKNMRLEVDATLQYARDSRLLEDDLPRAQVEWWAPITPAEKQINSPFNTYKNSGLPPRPISNPGLAAIEAALRPASTTCLYYLHDNSGEIHCSPTFAGHKQNIEKYLR